MKRLHIISALLLMFSSHDSNSQKYDNTWLMGCCADSLRINGGIEINFINGFPDTSYINRKKGFEMTSMSISDPVTGKLLLYSNGCDVFNSIDSIVENGTNINPGENHIYYCEYFGYNLPKGGSFIPHAENENVFFLIHRALDDKSKFVNKLYYSLIDISYNDGKGKVLKKNIPLLNQSLHRRHFDIVKHANGVDYWIITFNFASDTVFRFLTRADSIIGPMFQVFNIPRVKEDQDNSSIVSPDGKTMIRFDPGTGLYIMDFDRSNGLLSNLKFSPFWSTIDSVYLSCLSISPNSRFLYLNTVQKLYQFDLHSQDVFQSRMLIDTFDWFADPFLTYFFLTQLAPDGKIYMNVPNGSKYFHTIHKPDLPGKLCNFKQHDFVLPTQNIFTMPYFPNYRLGPITQVKYEEENDLSFKIPNPIGNQFTIESDNIVSVQIFDLNGKTCYYSKGKLVDTRGLSSAVYMLELTANNSKKYFYKIVVP